MTKDHWPTSSSITMTEFPSFTPAEAIEILRHHHGLSIGGLRKGEEAPYLPFEQVLGIAILHEDTAVAELLTALVGMITYDPDLLVRATSESARPRLRLCAVVAAILLEISTLGVRDPSAKKRQVNRLKALLCDYRMDDDTWNAPDRNDPSIEPEYWNGLFREVGLTARWPIADFMKRWSWSKAFLDKTKYATGQAHPNH
jgi:hypothetical protein